MSATTSSGKKPVVGSWIGGWKDPSPLPRRMNNPFPASDGEIGFAVSVEVTNSHRILRLVMR